LAAQKTKTKEKMAHTPPINIRELRKKGFYNEAEFYRLLSEANNYMDPKAAKEFYIGLTRVVQNELRTKGTVFLPELGYFAMVKQKPKVGWAGQFQTIINGIYMLKFYPLERFRDYFTELSKTPGLEGKLDPREKLLGQQL
jgi:hypothetical protein